MIGYMLSDYLGINVPTGPFSTHADPKYWHTISEISRQAGKIIDIKAAGLNHFTWVLSVIDKRTGEDLYPRVREAWAKSNPAIEPLTHRVYDAFGLMPVPGDEHLDEYLPWCSDPLTQPWEKLDLSLYDWDAAEKGREEGHKWIKRMGDGEEEIDRLKETDSEGALEIIEAAATGENEYHVALNLPNTGQIPNLPFGMVVETPGVLTGKGPLAVAVDPMPEGVAELLRREAAVVKLCVDAAATGSRQLALQCLLLDPVITDIDVAKQILDDYLTTYRQYLPQFWEDEGIS